MQPKQPSSFVLLATVLTVALNGSLCPAEPQDDLIPTQSENAARAPRPSGQQTISPEVRAAVERGSEALKEKKYKDAINAFTAAGRLHPKNSQLRQLLGVAYLRDKQIGQAWFQFRQAVRLNPQYGPAVQSFGTMWQLFGRRGALNVGQSFAQVAQAMGKPDRQIQGDKLTHWLYGFMQLNFFDGQLYSVVDPRGLDAAATRATEEIQLEFDGRPWSPGLRKLDRSQSLMEYLPPGQTVQNWQEQVIVQRLFRNDNNDMSLHQMMEQMRERLSKTYPEAVWQVIEEQEDSAIYEWRVKGSQQQPSRHEITRLMAGQNDVHRIAYTRQVDQLSSQDRERWVSILQGVTLKPMAEGKPDPAMSP